MINFACYTDVHTVLVQVCYKITLKISFQVMIMLDDVIQYKQWTTKDRTNLQDFSNTPEDFLEKLAENVDKLPTYHFIAKHQSSYLPRVLGEYSTN